eukprot:753000-Hanusia_phi.AAC.2
MPAARCCKACAIILGGGSGRRTVKMLPANITPEGISASSMLLMATYEQTASHDVRFVAYTTHPASVISKIMNHYNLHHRSNHHLNLDLKLTSPSRSHSCQF